MADSITYFGDPIRATYPNGDLIIVNGRPLLIPPSFNLQNQINAAHSKAGEGNDALLFWLLWHYALGSSGDPQRQAGHSGGFDPRYTDAGNYAFGLSAAAAGLSRESALAMAAALNKAGAHKALPAVNENAIRRGFDDYEAKHFANVDDPAGAAYAKSVAWGDGLNALETAGGLLIPSKQITESDVQRYAKAHWGDLKSPDAQAFMTNFQQALGGYPQHVDIDLLHPLSADGSIPRGRDVSLFVGQNGEVLVYAKPPAPGGTAFRGIYGLDGAPNGSGGTGFNFFQDGTPQPVSIRPHLTTPSDPTGGIDVTLADGSKEHWWKDPIDGFIRFRLGQRDSVNGYDTPSERLGHVPGSIGDSSSPRISPSFDDHSWAPSSEDVTGPASVKQRPARVIRPAILTP